MKSKQAKFWPQLLLTVLCNLGTLTFGLHCGWLAPLHLQFASEESPLGEGVRSFTTEEISWIAALPALTFIVGTPIYGFLLQRIGRRLSALVAVLPNIASFLMLMLARDVATIYAARLVSGIASAGSLIIGPIYVNESAADDVRGFLCGLSAFFVNVGVVISTAAGGYLSYLWFNAFCLSFSLVFCAFFPWLPETPVFLVSRGRIDEAKLALRKLRPKSEIDGELRKTENLLKERETSKKLTDILKNGPFRRAAFIAVGVMTVHQLSGFSAISTYSTKIFHDSGSSISPVLASTITGFMLLAGSITGAYLMDKVGRKSLLLTSVVAMTICLAAFSIFLFFRPDNLGWIPPVIIFIYTWTFSTGIGTVAPVLTIEMFPPEVRGVSGTICGIWVSSLGFFIIKLFPVIVEAFTLLPVIVAFLICCGFGSAFVVKYVVETRGRSPHEVLRILKAGRSMKEQTKSPEASKLR